MARGEAGPRSDLDLLVGLDEEASLGISFTCDETSPTSWGAGSILDSRALDPAYARTSHPA